jgi:hypothetical protein
LPPIRPIPIKPMTGLVMHYSLVKFVFEFVFYLTNIY